MFVLFIDPLNKLYRVLPANNHYRQQVHEVRIGDLHTEKSAHEIAKEYGVTPKN